MLAFLNFRRAFLRAVIAFSTESFNHGTDFLRILPDVRGMLSSAALRIMLQKLSTESSVDPSITVATSLATVRCYNTRIVIINAY